MSKKRLAALVKSEADKPTTAQKTDLQTPKQLESETTDIPKYLTLVRKETRLREDQLDELTRLTRRLNRARNGGERLTENTLIRVAVDLLLSQSEALSGNTEHELRDSVSS
ncbi:MAG: hypothetical protein F6J87_19640 [Spirulina sp. SIO3F2]|nr:hypothetical protein [Spirulina sp. SIO3F2]